MEIESLAFGGDGVGRRADGKVVFVPLTVPGDRVDVRITEERARYCRGELLAVLAPAPDRRRPPCDLFGRCGGCQWQQLTYRAQVEAKQRIFAFAVNDARNDASTAPLLPAPAELGYRRRVRLRWRRTSTRALTLGLARRASHDLIDVRHCPLLEPALEPGLDAVRAVLGLVPVAQGSVAILAARTGALHASLRPAQGERQRELARAIEARPELAGGQVGQVVVGLDAVDCGQEGDTLWASAASFVQANAAQNHELDARLGRWVEGGATILELFAGVGNLTRGLARRARRLVAVESSPASAALLRRNTADLPCAVEAVHARVEEEVPRRAARGERFDVVVLDPPREGCARATLEAVASLGPGRLVYVSCDPMTLARDLKHLAALGLRLVEVRPLDMMPQTFHVEALALLARGEER